MEVDNTKPIDRAKVWAEARRISNAKADTDDCVAVALLLASCIVGPSVSRCASFLEIAPARISWMAANLRRNGVWKGRHICAAWDDPQNGGAELLLDSCVALGYLERAKGGRRATSLR